jgi:hypothetical protein
MTQYIRKDTNEQEEVKEFPKTFVMNKNCRGYLTVVLDTFDYSAPSRELMFSFDQDTMYVPWKWALGVFVTRSAEKMMVNGFFTFEKLELLIEMAEYEGLFVSDSIKQPKVTTKELRKLVMKNDVDGLKQKMFNANSKTINDLVGLAKKAYDKLNILLRKLIKYL